jgi:hypothetical protein
MSLCPACAYREAIDGDMCRDCAGQLALPVGDVKPCVACGCVERTKWNQCVRCQRRRALLRYRRRHGLPTYAPVGTLRKAPADVRRERHNAAQRLDRERAKTGLSPDLEAVAVLMATVQELIAQEESA